MATNRDAVARAVAIFEASDDIALLHRLVGEIAPRARRMVAELMAKGSEDTIPPPVDLRAARQPASREEALKTLRAADDFGMLQTMARAIGRRIEAMEIAASAEFPEGARVMVPMKQAFPPAGERIAGSVEETGTSLRVRLDNGETWNGPPSLARLEAREV